MSIRDQTSAQPAARPEEVTESPCEEEQAPQSGIDLEGIWDQVADAALEPMNCIAKARGLHVYAPPYGTWGESVHDEYTRFIRELFDEAPPPDVEEFPEEWNHPLLGFVWDWGFAPVTSLHLVDLIEGPGTRARPVFLEAFNDDICQHRVLGAVVSTARQRDPERWRARAVRYAIDNLGFGLDLEYGPVTLPWGVYNNATELIPERWLKEHVAGWVGDDADWGRLLGQVVSEESGEGPFARFTRSFSRIQSVDLKDIPSLAEADEWRLEEIGEELKESTREVLFNTYWSSAYN